ncbi:hypothetical protein [Pseudomonas sp. 2FG]|uniref:hypothetical protein n=1 Tax=Pseudomonas sp. 2FG TaxID=2502191 RepID=UPI0010F7E244|nr:hypothetical protein [Pseudomonas sp. 2FG]
MDGEALVKLGLALAVAYFLVLRPVLSYLSNRMIVASVAAELKAQCGDQELVKEVCFSEFGMGHILGMKSSFPKSTMRSAMITASLLAEVALSEQFSKETRGRCHEFLRDRLGRFYANPLAVGSIIRPGDVNILREKYDQASQALA